MPVELYPNLGAVSEEIKKFGLWRPGLKAEGRRKPIYNIFSMRAI
jgi:hypothetical protein